MELIMTQQHRNFSSVNARTEQITERVGYADKKLKEEL